MKGIWKDLKSSMKDHLSIKKNKIKNLLDNMNITICWILKMASMWMKIWEV